MTHLWNPEQTLEPPLALELIREQFPELSPTKIRLLGAGWDNTAFLINEDLIFRFPRREIALPLLEAEWSILPKLAPHLPLPVPVPKWRGSPTSRFPWPFIGYKMLPGFTACYANLSEDERAALAEPIAHFLSKLHNTPGASIAGCHIFGDNRSRIDGSVLIPKILKNFEELALLKLLENRKELESILEKSTNLRAPMSSVVVHGDFYVRHLLVDERHHLVGVIDWGDVHLGDPAMDLSIAHSFLPKQAHKTFRDAYGEISHDTWALARLRAIYSSTMLVLYGHHSGDPSILREGLRSLKVIQLP
jgi:aminoglycoside phosphotransferase (APT) family kinase protein